MRSANPKSSGEGVVDLSNNHDWQLRLTEARARRAEALKEANKQAAPTRKKVMPWEEQDKVLPPLTVEREEPAREMDFHDRVNRFKRISRIQPPRERTPEEIALIEAKLSGKYVPPAPAGKTVLPQILGDNSDRSENATVQRSPAPVMAAKAPAKSVEPQALGVPDDQPEEVFRKTIAKVVDEEKAQKPIERATTRIIWFAEPEEENINITVAKTVSDVAEADEALEPEKVTEVEASVAESPSVKAPSRLPMAIGLAFIGTVLLAAAAYIIPMTR